MRKLLSLLLLSAVPLGVAQAHDPWIKPSAATVSGEDGWVNFDAGVSTDPFIADHFAMRLEQIHAYAPDGSEVKLENAAAGRYRSAFDLHMTQPGTYRVGTASSAAGVSGSYVLNGETVRVGGRGGPPPGAGAAGTMPPRPGGAAAGTPGNAAARPAAATGAQPQRPTGPSVSGGPDFKLPAGATDVKLSESSSRNEVYVTLGKPTPVPVTGKGLELQPISHPSDLVADEPGRFRFLIDGKPAPNVAVKVIPDGRRYRDDSGEMKLTTDAQGEIAVKWGNPGLYWVRADVSDQRPSNPAATQRRMSYVTTLEVMAP